MSEADAELRARALERRIALFEDRLILKAQPPITDAQLAEIESLCIGPVPPGLRALWEVSFGGRVNYDLRVDFGSQVASFSFAEIFYPGSQGYHDLHGWIEHELEGAAEAADDEGREPPTRLAYLPFGGFEYLDRLYVCVEQGPDHGAVYAWMQGLPPAWALRLHEDSIARIADDVPALFRMLDLEEDPFTADEDSFATGSDMAEELETIAGDDPDLAAFLTGLVRGAIVDWESSVEDGTIAGNAKLRRLALDHAATNGDTELMARLAALGCDLEERFRGGGNLLDHSLAHGHVEAANWLLAREVDARNSLLSAATCVPPDMVVTLLERGATVVPVAIRSAAQFELVESARLMTDALAQRDPASLSELIDDLDYSEEQAIATATRIESGKMSSNRTGEQYRKQAADLRAVRIHAERLSGDRLGPPPDDGGWLGKLLRGRRR